MKCTGYLGVYLCRFGFLAKDDVAWTDILSTLILRSLLWVNVVLVTPCITLAYIPVAQPLPGSNCQASRQLIVF